MLREILNHHAMLKKQAQNNPMARMALMKMEMDMPTLRTPESIKNMEGYYKSLAESYGIGYLYSEALLSKHLEDSDKIKDLMGKIITQEKTIQEVLDYYGINAKNYEVYNTVQDRIAEVKRFKM